MESGSERRKFKRVDYSCKVEVIDESGESLYLTDAENISCGGVCFVLPEALKLYTVINLEINLRDTKPPIKCRGKVVWCLKNPPSPSFARRVFFVGVEFLELPEADRERIEKIINVSEGK